MQTIKRIPAPLVWRIIRPIFNWCWHQRMADSFGRSDEERAAISKASSEAFFKDHRERTKVAEEADRLDGLKTGRYWECAHCKQYYWHTVKGPCKCQAVKTPSPACNAG